MCPGQICYECYQNQISDVTNNRCSDKLNNGKRFYAPSFTLWGDNINFPCFIFKFVMHVANNQFSDKFNNCCKKLKWSVFRYFFYFTFFILPCGRDHFKSVPCNLLKFVLHVAQTSSRTSLIWLRAVIECAHVVSYYFLQSSSLLFSQF